MTTYSSDIDQFVDKFFCKAIKTALIQHISDDPNQFNLSKAACDNAVLNEMIFKSAV